MNVSNPRQAESIRKRGLACGYKY